MPLALSLDQIIRDLSPEDQRLLCEGQVVLTGQTGQYAVWGLVEARDQTVWQVLTDYEGFPTFLPSVVACRVLERQGDRTVVERKDRRKIGWMPIKVKLVTENIETSRDRIDYRMVSGTLDSMEGMWQLIPLSTPNLPPTTLLVQTIAAKANLGPLQDYFYQVFETGLVETMTDLRAEMERRDRA